MNYYLSCIFFLIINIQLIGQQSTSLTIVYDDDRSSERFRSQVKEEILALVSREYDVTFNEVKVSGFFAFLGIISLAGIIINNAIVLIDRIEVESTRNNSLVAAVREACLQRFRPIILTTFTTVLGMIPLYMGGGIMWEPLAAAIMFGLLFGTIVTLIFVPVSYVLFYGKRKSKPKLPDLEIA